MKSTAYQLQPSHFELPDHELARLIGWPRRRAFDSATAALAAEARRIFLTRARPWHAMHAARITHAAHEQITLESGERIEGAELARRIRATHADELVILGISAGREIAGLIEQFWNDSQPDLAYVLSGVAVGYVEQALQSAYRRICAAAEDRGRAALRPMSPGNDSWPLAAQEYLYRILDAAQGPLPVEMSIGFALYPAASQLAVVALTPCRDRVRSDPNYMPCRHCALRGCEHRRTAYVEPAFD